MNTLHYILVAFKEICYRLVRISNLRFGQIESAKTCVHTEH